ncbi:MAG: hypothetical protein A4E48_00278 [Methanosaeta sp. PtaU1.Bin060]|nr:MAG: hypothetical protein A4E48_00278 [Methanosaeta sp. PtaU1.Bin060]
MIFQIGNLMLGAEGPDPGPKMAEWKRTNKVVVKEIPGKGKHWITERTSDITLWSCTLTVRSITDSRYKELKELIEDGGPFKVVCNHGSFTMYVIGDGPVHEENDKEPPLKHENGDYLNVATWTLQLQEAYD